MVLMKIPKQHHRLLSSREFKTVYAKGRKFSTPYFSAFVIKTDSEHQRLGLTTTRKIGNAVFRNRCRRRLRDVFRFRDLSLLSGVGFDVVLNVRPSTATADFKEIELAFGQFIQRFRQTLDKESA
jgi:ribonuclease P protein component